MAIFHYHLEGNKRSASQNAVAHAAYISASKLTYTSVDAETGEVITKIFDYRHKDGVAVSNILAPEGAPSWVFEREELWNRSENAEKRINSRSAEKITLALPVELSLEQNIELVEDYAKHLVEQGTIVDYNIHYDNPKNPHVHLALTTRELDSNNITGFSSRKNRNWYRRNWLKEQRQQWANIQNKYLELYGFDARVSHLSHEERGIDLTPGKHEGPARHIKDSELRANNLRILKKNATAILENPELVFDKISINKPVFTKEDIAIHLSDALSLGIEALESFEQKCEKFGSSLDQAEKGFVADKNNQTGKGDQIDNNINSTQFSKPSKEEIIALAAKAEHLSKEENHKIDDKTKAQKLEENRANHDKDDISALDQNSTDLAAPSTSTTPLEDLNEAFDHKFLSIYSNLLLSPKIELLNPSDLRGRTLYALTKRLDLERRYVASLESLNNSSDHRLNISKETIGIVPPNNSIISYLKEAGKLIESKINDVTSLNLKYFRAKEQKLSEMQRKAVYEIVNGSNISLLEGFPGSGKTFTMRELVRLYEKSGYKVIGTAKSSVAAQILESETGVVCTNSTLLRKALMQNRDKIALSRINSQLPEVNTALSPQTQPKTKFEAFLRTDYFKEDKYKSLCDSSIPTTILDSKTVLLIDEAGMMDLPDMDYLLSEAKVHNCKVIMLGDNNQLPAVGTGGAFKKAKEVIGSSLLSEVQRHKNENKEIQNLQRKATELLGKYKINDAIEIYKALNYLKLYDTKEETLTALVDSYISDYLITAKSLKSDNLSLLRSIAIGTYTNEYAHHLNKSVRAKLLSSGVLKGEAYSVKNGTKAVSANIRVVSSNSIAGNHPDPAGNNLDLAANHLELAIGEQIVFTSNKAAFGGRPSVLNGELGTVLRIKEINIQDKALNPYHLITVLVHRADGHKKIIEIDTSSPYPVSFDYGYAITSHKLQGASIDNMKVLFEPSMGYEAFNVLMSRYKYDMKFFANTKELEKIVWDRAGRDLEHLKENNILESYTYASEGKARIKRLMPNWQVGLNLAAGKRANNNFADNYRAKEHLSSNELVIKEYLEVRGEVFALEEKMRQWKSNMESPLKLTALYGVLNKTEPGLFKTSREINLDPYALLFEKKDPKIASIMEALPEHDKDELKAIFELLLRAKSKREEVARVIINNYDGWVGKEESNNQRHAGLEGERQPTFADRIIQYNLNYNTIEKHANLSPIRHILKSVKNTQTISSNDDFGQIMDVVYDLGFTKNGKQIKGNVTSGNDNVENHFTESDFTESALIKVQNALNNLNKHILDTRAHIENARENLKVFEKEYQLLLIEQKDIAAFSNQLLPEFISRVYKASPQEIIKAWDELVANQGIKTALKVVGSNPIVLGSLKGLGIGNFIGLTRERKEALIHLNQLPGKLMTFEQNKTRSKDIENQIEEKDYLGTIEGLRQELHLFKNSMPSKHEETLLKNLNDLNKGNNLSLETLTDVAKQDDVQGLIYEYYNLINESYLSKTKPSTGISANKQHFEAPTDELQALSDRSTAVKSSLPQDHTIKEKPSNARINPQTPSKTPSLTFNEVLDQLSSTDYRNIFEKYASLINEDGGIVKERGDQLSLGSLTMNIQKGLWTRYSTNESGNIFSFVQKALNCSKYESLQEVAIASSISENTNKYISSENLRTENLKTKIDTVTSKEPKDQWIAKDIVPISAPNFDPNIHLKGLLQDNKVGGLYPYHNLNGQLLGYTIRLISLKDGTKQVMPVSYCTNEYQNKEAWRLKGFLNNNYKPIYGLEKLNSDNKDIEKERTALGNPNIDKPILIVEGEKTADNAQKLFPEYNVLSWLGGSASASKANWQLLQGREVVIFPDNDEPGIGSANQIASLINDANGYIGKVTIIDPSSLTFEGKTHTNILPQKWDLGDNLPLNLTIANIKEAIDAQKEQMLAVEGKEIQEEQATYLNEPSNFRGANERKITQEQRIYSISKLAGILIPESQIIDLAAKEREISEKLLSNEAKYYMKNAEIKGLNESAHKFLPYSHPLYISTLSAISVLEIDKLNSSVLNKGKDRNNDISSSQDNHIKYSNNNKHETIELPDLINTLQSSYEKKASSFMPFKTLKEKELFDKAKKEVETSYQGSTSKAEAFESITKDILFLRELELQNLKINKLPSFLNIYQDTIEHVKDITLNYRANNRKGIDPNKLHNKDFAEIADIAYKELCSSKYYEDQTKQHLSNVKEFKSVTAQIKQFNSAKAAVLSQMPKEYGLISTIEAANDVIKTNKKKYEDKKLYAKRAVYDRYSKVLEDIEAFNGKVNKEEIVESLTTIEPSQTLVYLSKIREKALENYLLPKLKAFNVAKGAAKDSKNILEIVTSEQKLLSDLYVDRKDAMQYYSYSNYLVYEAATVIGEKPHLINDLNKITDELQKKGYMKQDDITSILKSNINIESVYTDLEKIYEDHSTKSTLKEFKDLKNITKTTADGLNLLESEQSYLNHLSSNFKYKEQNPELALLVSKAASNKQDNIMQELKEMVSSLVENKYIDKEEVLQNLLSANDPRETLTKLGKIHEKSSIKTNLSTFALELKQSDTVEKALNIIEKEQNYLSDFPKTLKYYKEKEGDEELSSSIYEALKQKDKNTINNLRLAANYSLENGIISNESLVKLFQQRTNLETLEQKLYITCKDTYFKNLIKNLKTIEDSNHIIIDKRKFDSQIQYLKHEINHIPDIFAHDEHISNVLKNDIAHIESKLEVQNPIEEHSNQHKQLSASQTQKQKVLEKTKADDFEFNM